MRVYLCHRTRIERACWKYYAEVHGSDFQAVGLHHKKVVSPFQGSAKRKWFMAAYCWKRNTETDRQTSTLVVRLSLCHADRLFDSNPSENAYWHLDALPSMCMSSVNLWFRKNVIMYLLLVSVINLLGIYDGFNIWPTKTECLCDFWMCTKNRRFCYFFDKPLVVTK